MSNSIVAKVAFVVVCVVQLGIVSAAMFNKQEVIESGIEYRLKLRTRDPVDPIRGRFVALNFARMEVPISKSTKVTRKQEVYVQIDKDSAGFARPIRAYTTINGAPRGYDYIKTRVIVPMGVSADTLEKVILVRPTYNKYYLQEDLAKKSDWLFGLSTFWAEHDMYAVVKVRGSESVLQHIEVDGMDFEDFIKQHNPDE